MLVFEHIGALHPSVARAFSGWGGLKRKRGDSDGDDGDNMVEDDDVDDYDDDDDGDNDEGGGGMGRSANGDGEGADNNNDRSIRGGRSTGEGSGGDNDGDDRNSLPALSDIENVEIQERIDEDQKIVTVFYHEEDAENGEDNADVQSGNVGLVFALMLL
jgi:hypothetical protein